MREDCSQGYNGRILRVNLSTGNYFIEDIGNDFCRKYLGGAGFVSYFLWKEIPRGIDPLGPENKLVFAAGPLTGGALPGTGRHCVGAKSPLTGGVAKSEAGEFWGAQMKRTGFDCVIIEGKADKPIYLVIQDSSVTIKDAGHLWGLNTKDTQSMIRSELSDKSARLALIGPGGENKVLYACIMHGLYDAAGRGGLGAVMGSKNLKAIAVRGRKSLQVADPSKLKEIKEWLYANLHTRQGFSDYGTGFDIAAMELLGNLPVNNFNNGLFPQLSDITPQTMMESAGVKMDACYGCPIRCKKVVKMDQPYIVDPSYGGPEYETLASLGTNCGIGDLAAICKGSELCNAYSLDTISTGEVIAFAMECFERGLITIQDTHGINLRFGNAEAMIEVIGQIAERKGIGELLAQGSRKAAALIGNNAEEFAIQVKGLEAGMHDPRSKMGLGIGFMVNPNGADHCLNLHDHLYLTPESNKEFVPLGMPGPLPIDEIGPRKVALFKLVQSKTLIMDSLVMCQFFPYTFQQIAEATAAATGWNTGVMEQLKIAERILTTFRLFNMREGFSEKHDELPDRFFQPKADGVLSSKPLNREHMERARRYYYRLMGWDDNTGIPLKDKLEELEIS